MPIASSMRMAPRFSVRVWVTVRTDELVELSAQLVFPESRDREKLF
jgi:hypothetical protein